MAGVLIYKTFILTIVMQTDIIFISQHRNKKESDMNNFLKIISALSAALLLLSGCDKIEDKPVNNDEISEQSSAAEETEPTLPERDRTIDTSTEFVFDDAKVLSSSDYDALNEYTAWISKTFKINAAVVTTDDMGDKTAEEYANDYYSELYGGSNGVMFLVNNDTGKDYILRKGAPSLFISGSDIEMLFSEISPLLVTGSYRDAINQTLEFIEISLPEFAIDRTNKMSAEEITAVNDILAGASGESESLSMIFIGDIGEKKISDYAKEQSEKYFEDGGSSAIMVVNTQSGEYYICSQGDMSSLEENQGDIKDSVLGCLTETDGKKSFDFKAAADIFVNFAGI